jgi:hypothetical protein
MQYNESVEDNGQIGFSPKIMVHHILHISPYITIVYDKYLYEDNGINTH